MYSCHPCSESKKIHRIFFTAVVFVLTILGVSFVVSDLIRAVDDEGADAVGGAYLDTPWRGVFPSRNTSIMKAIPLTAVKIMVVVWQILTQVCNAPVLSKIHAQVTST